jgi:hypothetical protein
MVAPDRDTPGINARHWARAVEIRPLQAESRRSGSELADAQHPDAARRHRRCQCQQCPTPGGNDASSARLARPTVVFAS